MMGERQTGMGKSVVRTSGGMGLGTNDHATSPI
jgi:hypothetical protein